MEGFLSPDDAVRNQAVKEFRELTQNNPQEVLREYPKYVDQISKMDSDLTAIQVAGELSKVVRDAPQTPFEYEDQTIQSLTVLAEKPISQDTNWESVISTILAPISTQLQQKPEALEKWLPLLFSLCTKGDSIRYMASAPITTVAMKSPQLLQNHVPLIFEAMKAGFTTLSTSLLNLYPYAPEEFEKNVDFLLSMYQSDPNWQGMALNILLNIAKANPEAFDNNDVLTLEPGLNNAILSAQVLMIFQEIAKPHPEYFTSMIPTLEQIIPTNPNLLYQISDILGLIGRQSISTAKQVLPILDKIMSSNNDLGVMQAISEFRNLAELDRGLFDGTGYVEKIRGFESHPQEYVRDQARAFIDYIEKRDIRSLASQIDEYNAKFSAAATSTEDLMAYIDENVAMLKDFIGEFSKKLPTPIKFSTEGRVRKTLILHFVCDREDQNCLFPHDREFTTETKAWSKWLKIGMSAIKIGKSVIVPAAGGGALNAIKEVYESYKEKDDKEFLAYIGQPFLTSEEQDSLVNQLRDSKFFNVFSYDAQIAGWVCTMCGM